MESIYTLGTSSASHTYGNVASCIKVYLEKFFPEGFITRTYIDSKIAWKEINDALGNGDREFVKRHYPFLIINPRFTDQDTSRYLYNVPLTKNMDNAESGLRRNTLFPVIKDRKHQMELCYKINRDAVTFEVELRLKSLVQQLDVYKNLENQLIWETPFTHQVSLESMIPRSMITYLGKVAGIDVDQSTEVENLTPLLVRYLNNHARNPITYKVRTSTSVEEFFMYYDANLLLTFTDLRMGDGQKKNVVDDYYPITFTVAVEFNLPGLYALVGTHERRFDTVHMDLMVHSGQGDPGIQMIPIYTYTNLYRNLKTERRDGLQFYSSTIVKVNKEDDGKEEVIDLRDVIAPTHMKVLTDYLRDGIPIDTLFQFSILCDNHDMPQMQCFNSTLPMQMWDIDWDRRLLTIYHGDPTVTYRIIVYANMIQINERLGSMQDKTKFDINKL